METVRTKPAVVLFHDVINTSVLTVLKDYAHNKQRDQAWSVKEKYHTPSVNVELVLSKLTRAHARREMRQLQKHLTSLARIMIHSPARWAGLQVINVGLEGMHLSRHTRRLQLLNSATEGGQAVLEKFRISVTPEKGSVLFYAVSETKPNSFCPVIGESLWGEF
ncbi:hypothetical protein ElyMa_006831200 [Elysia marginata]|uniref:Uncharacterized protein n=1 Tax=Elysia marginata TaxID=1093978 RepID=A0AAV4J5X1_9GAST|nr:hypothetical protein ElyMa_006831200 [Elysia marginata]